MPIEPGGPWGETVRKRDDLPTFRGEEELGWFLSRTETERRSSVALTSGRFVDLTGGSHLDESTMRKYCSDIVDYRAEGRQFHHGSTIGSISILTYVAPFTWGQIYISNLGLSDGGLVSDRSHPNDGRFEVLDAHQGLPLRDLLMFRYRVRQGLAINHRKIRRRSTSDADWSASRMWVRVDGARQFSCRRIVVSIRPDALEIFIPAIPERQ